MRRMGGVAIAAGAVFGVITAIVTSNHSLGLDAGAFDVADDIRASWLGHVARVVTSFGLLAIVGPAVVAAAAMLWLRGRGARAAALVTGAALAWLSVWITKAVVGRARPPHPVVHTVGHSYPSAHAANAVGWLALAVALTCLIGSRLGRVAAVSAGAALAVLVGLSRIYLRAHYLSDVIAGEALAVTMYALAVTGVLRWRYRRGSR